MIVGLVRETSPGERRVALTPAALPALTKAGIEVVLQRGAGALAGFPDQEYEARGARTAETVAQVLEQAAVICGIRIPSSLSLGAAHTAVGLADPLAGSSAIVAMAESGARCFALELLPRITRAQSMDVLSSQATVAGYKAVLLAAEHLSRMMPMMMTAAGTIPASKAFVIGAGVAGLQAIASSRRLGAVVTAYDVRPVVQEQVQSLGAKFLHIPLSSAEAEGSGGYAKAMEEEFYQRQREMMAASVAQSDVVITTAAIPGKPPPVLVTADAVRGMKPGSVIVDLAARTERAGGNCELTRPDEAVVTDNHVTVLGPTNLPASVPQTASALYARNMASFLRHIVEDGALRIDMNDEITRDSLLCENGSIINQRVKHALAVSGSAA
jgi:H+-translocating NAD(P) transhydrogenase subunit alpha